MACFVVPMGAAIVTTAISKKVPEECHVNWLNAMLWGGVAMLAVEHVAHGEVIPYPPFLTASLRDVFPEMMMVGAPMTLAIFLIWMIMITVCAVLKRRQRCAEAI